MAPHHEEDASSATRSGDIVLSGLCGELVCGYLLPAELRTLTEVSRELNVLASACVKNLAPKHAGKLGALSQRFTSVTAVDLGNDALQTADVASVFRALGPFRLLRYLRLHGLTVTDTSMSSLTAASRLEKLDLRGCSKLTWGGLGQLSALEELRALNCSGVKYMGQSCGESKQLHAVLERLESLTMGDPCTLSWVDDRLMTVVGQHAPNLVRLDCGGCIDMTDQGVGCIRGMTKLENLSLQSCVRLTNNSLASVAELSNLRHLNIRGCLQVNDAGLNQLSKVTDLETLNLSCCLGIQSLDAELFKCLKHLSSLNVSNCTGLSSLASLSVLAASLTDLNIASCSQLTLSSLEAMSSLTALTSLDMSNFCNQTRTIEQGRLHQLASLKNMQALHLSRFRHPQGLPTGLLQAIAAMTKLRVLHMAGCCAQTQPASDSAPQGTGPWPAQPGAGGAPSGSSCTPEGGESQLWFLEPLVQLTELDLSGWRHGTARSLLSLSGLTELTWLKLQRWGNDATATVSDGAQDVHRSLAPISTSLHNKTSCQSTSPDAVGDAQISPPSTSDDRSSTASPATAPAALYCEESAGALGWDGDGMRSLERSMAAVYIANSDDKDDKGGSSSSSVGTMSVSTHALPASGLQEGAEAALTFERALACLHRLCKLDKLDLEACLSLDDSCLHHLARLPRLRHLHLAGCKKLQGLTLSALAPSSSPSTYQGLSKGCPRLEELSLDDCTLVADDALLSIAHLTSLTHLSLKGCPAVGDVGVQALALSLRRLSHLAMFGAARMTSRAVEAIASLPHLKNLHIPHCWNVDDQGILALKHSRSLSLLGVSHCWRLSTDAIVELRSSNPHLMVTHSKASVACS